MSNRYKGGIISATPPTTTGGTTGAGSASGVWTLEQQMQAKDSSAWPDPTNYIEDVFSTYLYTGNSGTQTITNGIDLSSKGGLVWAHCRSTLGYNALVDTVRGATKKLNTDRNIAQYTDATTINAFSTTGFTTGSDSDTNFSGQTFAAWTFRKQPKFFDVVTFTQVGTSGLQTISHNLGSVPGCIIFKATNQVDDWYTYHRSIPTQRIRLNTTAAANASGTNVANNLTSTTFDFNISNAGNANGTTFVAYLFAHDAGGFGLTGTNNVISCGSFTTDASGNGSVNLGYEPQWVLIKEADGVADWWLMDNMRGFSTTKGTTKFLNPDTSAAEITSTASWYGAYPTATGFVTDPYLTNANKNVIYIAIRRGPMKVPTSGTSVFGPIQYTGTGSQQTLTGISFSPDYVHTKSQTGFGASYLADRLRGSGYAIQTETTSAESNRSAGGILSFNNNGFTVGTYSDVNPSGNGQIAWCFRRAPNFFDEVCYNRSSGATVTHNLGVTPELLIVKRRGGIEPWGVMRPNTTGYLLLNATDALSTGLSATATSTTFTLGAGAFDYSDNYVAYLFATCAGVSKVGSYTGNGSSQTIACGFTGGARFVLIKRTDSTGDWYVWDTARGIVTANDPHLSLNTTAAEVTTDDTIDPDNSGFIVNQLAATNVNVTSATYIFLAIA